MHNCVDSHMFVCDIYIYICIYIYMWCVCGHICIYALRIYGMYMHICMCIYIYMFIYLYVFVFIYIYIYLHMRKCTQPNISVERSMENYRRAWSASSPCDGKAGWCRSTGVFFSADKWLVDWSSRQLVICSSEMIDC